MMRVFRGAALVLLVAQACVDGGEFAGTDPRVGEEGRVKFVGGGCAGGSSTTIAVGATQTLTLEAQDDTTLPVDLSVGSSAPGVIDARAGAAADEVVLAAERAGEASVELLSGGGVWDRLLFKAEPAASVKISAPDAVLAGGLAWVKVDEVYGACGNACPMIGEGFVRWSAEPAAGPVFVDDVGGAATFRAGAAGTVRILGNEPSGGALLVDHPLSVVPVADAGAPTALVLVLLPDGQTVLDPRPPPVEVPVGSLLLIQLQSDAAGVTVPIAGADVSWTVAGDVSAVARNPLSPRDPVEGVVFSAAAVGSAELVGNVPLLGWTGRFTITVVPAPAP